jgi:hypothetical protein
MDRSWIVVRGGIVNGNAVNRGNGFVRWSERIFHFVSIGD